MKYFDVVYCDLTCESLAWHVTLSTSRVVLKPEKFNPWETWSALCQWQTLLKFFWLCCHLNFTSCLLNPLIMQLRKGWIC